MKELVDKAASLDVGRPVLFAFLARRPTASVSGCSPLQLSRCGGVWGGFTPEEYAGEQSEPTQSNLANRERSAAKSQPNFAKRMECVELAPAFDRAAPLESASKLVALHT